MIKNLIQRILALGLALAAASCQHTQHVAPAPDGRIDPAALDVVNALAAKLGGAQTIRVSAWHELDPALGLGVAIDRGPVEISVKRPNKFYAIQSADRETREIAYDGRFLCVMHPGVQHHALEPLPAPTIEQFAERVHERFGFRPPIAELLANHMDQELLIDVSSARLLGTERVGRTKCERVHLWQDGMTTDLWVGTNDRLPRRMLITVTELAGHPTWDIHFSKWELDVPLDEGLFSKRPASNSVKVQMHKSQ